MMNEQNFAVVDDKNRHGEINFFMDVRHKARPDKCGAIIRASQFK